MDQKYLDGLLELMQPMDKATPYFRGLIYGETGTRKTVQAALVGSKVLYIESDPEGWVSLRNHPELIANGRMVRMPFEGLSQLHFIAEAFEEGLEPFNQFDTIVLDTASNIAILDLDNVVEQRAKNDLTGKKNDDVATQPDFNFNTERIRKAFMRLLKLPVHVILTSHVREDEDKVTGMRYTRPSFTPKMRKTIEQMMHLIVFSTIVEQTNEKGETVFVHKWQCHPTRTIVAKSRIKGLPVILDSPNLGEIVAEWSKSEEALVPVEELPDDTLVDDSESVLAANPVVVESDVDVPGTESSDDGTNLLGL